MNAVEELPTTCADQLDSREYMKKTSHPPEITHKTLLFECAH
jgi:hypothetical protein